MKFLKTFVFLTCMVLATAGIVQAKKAALVIGNNEYKDLTPLLVAVNDAEAHCDHLKTVRKFEVVTCVYNATKRETDKAVINFLRELKEGDTAVFIYAGHGVQLDPNNPDTVFLIPTDLARDDVETGTEEWSLRQFAVQFDEIRLAIKRRNVRLSVFVLDNCRDNPLVDNSSRTMAMATGLGRLPADKGEFIFFSASEGETALDRINDGDKNSPFTSAFLDAFLPNVPLVSVANRVEQAVLAVTREAGFPPQRPRYDDNVEGPGCIEGLGECAVGKRVSVLDTEIDNALNSMNYRALVNVLPRSSGHDRVGEIQAAVKVHSEIDRQQTLLELDELKRLYAQIFGHPRREEVRGLIRRAILFQSCIELQRYGWACSANDVQVVGKNVSQPRTTAPAQSVDQSDYVRLSKEIDKETLGALSLPLDKVQTALASGGHYAGRVDGLNGPGTRRAIAKWRATVDSPETDGALQPLELVVLLQQVSDASAPSKALLGLFYAQGIGFEKDVSKGREMLEDAARNGFDDAKNWLAQLEDL